MQRPIRLKIFSIIAALLGLMVIVTWLSVLNFRNLNNQVRALSDYYLPLQEQVASVEILIRQQMVHMERLLAGMQASNPDKDYLARSRTTSTTAASTPTRSSTPPCACSMKRRRQRTSSSTT